MKRFYCVTSTFYDNGKVTAAITDCIESDESPLLTCKSTRRADIFNDWFDSREAAEEFVKNTRLA